MARISKERQLEIRNDILETAKQLFFSKGFEKTSTKEIAKSVGIAEGTLFNYYSDKNDLFLAAIAANFVGKEAENKYDYNLETVAPIIIYDFLYNIYKPILRLPKSLIIESGLAMLNAGKKHASALKKLMEMDFKYMAKLEALIKELKDKGLFIEETEPGVLSENIFSVFMFELFMYAYDKEMDKDQFFENFKYKIGTVCKGYMQKMN